MKFKIKKKSNVCVHTHTHTHTWAPAELLLGGCTQKRIDWKNGFFPVHNYIFVNVVYVIY